MTGRSGRWAVLRVRMPDGGFTLVEVMVSLAIFLMVSAAVLGLIMTSIRTVRGNADRVYAASLARAELDRLRTVTSESITLGQTSRVEPTSAGDFTITTTATWVDIGATVNPCQVGNGVNPGKAYLRVRVDVEGGDLQAPQSVDGVVYPTDIAPTDNTGSLTIAVSDDLGQALAGVTVTGSNGVQTFQQVTGPEGCVFVPDLVVDTDWVVTVSKSGLIAEQPGGATRSGLIVAEQTNTPVTFALAVPGSLVVTAGTGGYPVPAGVPFEFAPDTLDRAPTAFAEYPVTVTGLWPDQYTGWLRPCVGSGDGTDASVELPAGQQAALDLSGTRVQFVGPPGDQVVAEYDGPGCTTSYALGTWDDSLLIKRTLPAGTWTFRAPGLDPVTQTVELSSAVGLCSVSWDVPGAVDPNAEPTPTPTPTPTSTEEPSPTATPEPSPTPSLTLPEVSDPCPAG